MTVASVLLKEVSQVKIKTLTVYLWLIFISIFLPVSIFDPHDLIG